MEKLYGLVLSIGLVITGLAAYINGSSPVLAAAIVFIGIGSNLYFERRVIKEAASRPEKALSSLSPPIAETGLVVSIVYVAGFEIIGVIYLGLTMILSEFLQKSSQFGDVNTSRLLGRIARVLVLTTALVISYFNEFIIFYAVIFGVIIILYDFLILISETVMSSTI